MDLEVLSRPEDVWTSVAQATSIYPYDPSILGT